MTLCFLPIAWAGMRYGRNRSGIEIREVCAKNDTWAYDENGEYGADYVMLYNSSKEAINIGGYGLSDDDKNLYRFTLPLMEVPAGETIMVWNSTNNEDTSLYRADYVPTDIHGMSFGIAEGETIYLTDREGTVLDKAVAFLREKEESHPGLSEKPKFSLEGGWYEAPVTLELSSSTGEIYYTLDGSQPDENSLRYEGPIEITDRSEEENIWSAVDDIALDNVWLPDYKVDKGTVVKAVAISGEKRSEVVTKSFFVGLDEKPGYEGIAVMSITMDPEDLFGYQDGIYRVGHVMDLYLERFDVEQLPNNYYIYSNANYAKEGRGWERPAQVEYFSPDHEKKMEQTIGVRIHGGWSTVFNQKSFNLYARPEYDGSSAFAYDFFGKSYNKLMLRSGGYRDAFATKMRDVLNQGLVSDREPGIQRAQACAVFLNGEYWGLYNLQETIGSSYVEQNYDLQPEDVIVLKNPMQGNLAAEDPDAALYAEMVAFATDHDLSLEENYRRMEEQLDIQNYIDYFCFQIYVANIDSIGNNFATWRSREIGEGKYQDGKWRFLLYDTDDSAGMMTMYASPDIDSFMGGHWALNPLGKHGDPLFTALMENDEFKERFAVTFMDLVNYNFTYDRVHEAIEGLAEEYRDAVVKSQERFRGGPYKIEGYKPDKDYDGDYSLEKFDSDVAVIDDFYRQRAPYITEHMKGALELQGELAQVEIRCESQKKAKILVNTLALEAEDLEEGWTGTYYTDYPIRVTCLAQEGSEFVGWKVDGEVISDAETLEIHLTGNITCVEAVLK